ncbi:MAG: hypothetical protein EXR66_03375 [Dehalococcoidia bacterium]|nr:hypothetical protein [Dehalococcoidia bacterium]
MVERTVRTPRTQQGLAEDQAVYRVRAADGGAGTRARRGGATAAGELRDLVARRADALVELEKH